MAARSIGSGTVSFGLVSIPIKLFTATSPQSVSFNQLHKKCGGRIRQQLFCPLDNEIVQRTDIVKGFEYTKDRYVQFSEDELKKLEAERTDRIDIVEFVPEDTVDLMYIDRTYYLGPDRGGDRAYRLLSDAMTRMGRIAVGRFGTRGKEHLVLLRPYKGGLVMHYVFYADEVRSFDDVERPGEIEFKPVEADLADKLIEQLSKDEFDAEQYQDDYRVRVMQAVEQKAAGEEVTVVPEAPQAQIIDLFEALKRSLKSETAASVEKDGAPSERKPEVKKAGPKARESKSKKATG
ncbi:MAG: Ku protein [Polyangiaceae bacterium]|nr:Ku protein [Polyangiaceae bacterium]